MKSKYRNVLLPAVVLLAAPLAHAEDAPDWKFEEGVHYDHLVPAQGTSSPPDKIEVADLFTHGCTFCYRMDAYVEDWNHVSRSGSRHVGQGSNRSAASAHVRMFYQCRECRKYFSVKIATVVVAPHSLCSIGVTPYSWIPLARKRSKHIHLAAAKLIAYG